MSLRFCASADQLATAAHVQDLCSQYSGVDAPTSNGLPPSGQAFTLNTANDFVLFDFDLQPTWIIGFWFRCDLDGGTASPADLLEIHYGIDDTPSSADVQLTVNYSRTDERFHVFIGESTLAASMPQPATARKGWIHVAIKATISTIDGSYELRINDTTVLQATGLNTNPAGSPGGANRMGWSGLATAGWSWDGLYICDGQGSFNNNFLGLVYPVRDKPNGAGASSQWTPSSGANWETVDDNTPSGGTDYVEATSDGLKDLYDFGLTSGLEDIRGCQLTAYAQDTASALKGLTFRMKSGATEATGPRGALAAGQGVYKFLYDVFELDPNTSNQWTAGNLNSAQIGFDSEL